MDKTAVDEIFGFSGDGRTHPIFPDLPQTYATLFNYSAKSDSVYILATSPADYYNLCSLRAELSPRCFTIYDAAATSSLLHTDCGTDTSAEYLWPESDGSDGQWSFEWPEIARKWGSALDLNSGLSSEPASASARLLADLIPNSGHPNSSLPSLAEALAVLASNTILTSTIDTPLSLSANYTQGFLSSQVPINQIFHAMLSTQVYMSGATSDW